MAEHGPPGWVEHAIWWHVYPLGFVGADTTGADRSPTHRLARLEPWLDYLLDLGLNGLALGPVFASASHGYDTIDHFRVDPRLGDEDDLRRLLERAHARGIRVLLDGVFNHVGREFGAVGRALEDPGSEEATWFRRDESGALATFEGHEGLVAFDPTSPAVADHVAGVMHHWLDAGADGWRLDAAYALPPAFWAAVLPRVREGHPDAYIFGEVLHGEYAAFVRDGGLDAVTQYELWKAIWSAIATGNFFELDWTLKRHDEFLEHFVPYTFVGNHDVTRIASQIDDPRHLPHAVAALMTLGGTPAVYYGDERGLRGVKEERFGGDDDIRPAFPATPDELPDDDGGLFAVHQELIGLRRRHPWLHRARSETRTLTNECIVYRVALDADSLLVALNLGDEALTVEGAGGLLAGDATQQGSAWLVPGHGWAVLS